MSPSEPGPDPDASLVAEIERLRRRLDRERSARREAERIADERECMLYAEYSQNGVFAKKVRKEFE